MPRPSLRRERRQQLVEAFERVLAEHGFEGATIARLATEAGVSPGIVHHYFVDKDELTTELFRYLSLDLGRRLTGARSVEQLVERALRLDEHAAPTTARAWVGLWAEAVRKPALRRTLRRSMKTMMRRFVAVGASEPLALACLAMIVGFLVIGAVDPELTRGRAAGIAARLVRRWG